MKYGMLFANVGPFGQPDVAAELGAICEETGIESVWTVEHVVVPGGYASTYPYVRGRSHGRRRRLAHPRPARSGSPGSAAHTSDLAPGHRHPDPARSGTRWSSPRRSRRSTASRRGA